MGDLGVGVARAKGSRLVLAVYILPFRRFTSREPRYGRTLGLPPEAKRDVVVGGKGIKEGESGPGGLDVGWPLAVETCGAERKREIRLPRRIWRNRVASVPLSTSRGARGSVKNKFVVCALHSWSPCQRTYSMG